MSMPVTINQLLRDEFVTS